MRIYELAKELNTNSKTLMDKLKGLNINAKNHMSILDDDQLKAIYAYFGMKIPSDKSETQPETRSNVQQSAAADEKSSPAQAAPSKHDTGKGKKDAPRIIRTEVREIRTDANTGITTEIRTEIKGDHRREVRTNVSAPTVDKSKSDNQDYFEFRSPEARKKVSDMKIESQRPAKTEAPAISETKSAVAEKQPQIINEDKKTGAPVAEPAEIKNEVINKVEHTPAEAIDNKEKVNKLDKPETKDLSKANEPREIVSDDKRSEKTINKEAVKTETKTTFGNERERNVAPTGENKQGNNRTFDNNRSSSNAGNRQENNNRSFANNRQGNNRPFDNSGNRQGNNRPFDGSGNRQGGNRPFDGSANRPGGNRPFDGSGNRQGGNRPFDGNANRPGGNRPFDNSGNRQGGNRPFDKAASGNRPSNMPERKPYSGKSEQVKASDQSDSLEMHKPSGYRERDNKEKTRDVKKEVKPAKPAAKQGDKKYDQNALKSINVEHKVSDILNDDNILMAFYDNDNIKKKQRKNPNARNRNFGDKMSPRPEPVKTVLKVILPESLTVKDLGERLKKQAAEIIKKLFNYGVMATLNQEIDYETAAVVAEEFGYIVEKEVVVSEEDILFDDSEDTEESLETRAPIVVVMGHVDHGKTSLLDAIRETNVIAKEAGGITQHIGAYSVKVNDRRIAFLDTPGHEAFTAMRARGAQVTDIAILVVAADDGVMPQTVEAINHAKAANVSIIVAINKIDKPGADPDRVKQELTQHGLVSEEWGGDTIFVNVSAKKRIGIDSLLEMVLLVSDMMNLRANPNKQAKGTVIEAKLDKGRGPVATVLVQRGTLKTGDSIVVGTIVGRIRAMVDDKGQKVKKAKPSTPVEIIGLPDVPVAGEVFYAVEDEKIAKQLAGKRKIKHREETLNASSRVTLDDLFNQIQQGNVKELNIIVKADVQGSVEAVKQSLEKISNEEVKVKIIHGAVGAITESDVMLANVTNAIIIGFNVRPEASARAMADRDTVDIKLYRVIYEAIDDITAAMKGMLEPKYKEVILGHLEIRQLFKASGIGTIAGCYVTDGKITKNSDVRIVREGIVVFEGKIASLKRFKDDAKEVATGYECGLSLEKYNDLKEGDTVEAYIMEKIAVE